jgi:hypothetical protein
MNEHGVNKYIPIVQPMKRVYSIVLVQLYRIRLNLEFYQYITTKFLTESHSFAYLRYLISHVKSGLVKTYPLNNFQNHYWLI